MHPRKAASWSGVLPFASGCERKVWTRDLDSKRIFNVCVDRELIAARWRIGAEAAQYKPQIVYLNISQLFFGKCSVH